MILFLVAAAAFVALHLLVSGTRVRDALTGAIGQGPYMGLFSLASVGLLTWMIFAFGAARSDPMQAAYWGVTPVTRIIQLGLMLVAFLLVVPGLTTLNPASVRQEGQLAKPNAVQGMLRITRHPFLWGVAVWAAGHLLVDGDRAGIVLFGSLLLLAVLGTTSIDAKRKRALGESWKAFATQTSNVPFAAILAGRQSLNIGEIGWWRLALAVGLYAAMLFGHVYAFGVSPLP